MCTQNSSFCLKDPQSAVNSCTLPAHLLGGRGSLSGARPLGEVPRFKAIGAPGGGGREGLEEGNQEDSET